MGAVAYGDIGKHFPDTDPRYLNADSFELLRQVWAMEVFSKWAVGNIDLTIVAQKPKIAPFVPKMRERVASAFGIDVSLVSIKGTTTEKLGFTGRGEGIAAFCTVLLKTKDLVMSQIL